MNVTDVLIGENQIRVLTSADEYQFTRNGDTAYYQGENHPSKAIVDAIENNGIDVSTGEWPKNVTVSVHDENPREAERFFDRDSIEWEKASGMGAFVELTYTVSRNGDTTLVQAEGPAGEMLKKVSEDSTAANFSELWSQYTEDEFGNSCNLNLPETLNTHNHDEYGYMPKSQRSQNERTNWSKFYDFYTWLVENGYAIVSQDEQSGLYTSV